MCSKRKDMVYREDVINTTNKMLFVCDTKSLDDYRDLLVECFEVLPSAQPEHRWIPCSERLPEDEKKSYWVCTDTECQCECRWTNINHIWTDLTTSWHWHIMDIPRYSAVIAWMSLPEPYREGGDEG